MNRFALPWGKLGLVGTAAVVLVTALLVQGIVTTTAQTPTDHTAKVKVAGGGIAPVIECKWELPDMAPGNGTNNPYPDVTFEYDDNAAGEKADDLSSPAPSPATPCSLPTTGSPTQAANATHMMQIRANPGDKPELRRFQLWMAVDHPNGISNISDVYWDIQHPDGSPKQQVHGIRVPLDRCDDLGNSGLAGTMFRAAFLTGQLSAAAIDDTNRGMVALCHEQVKAIYYGEWTLSKEQACGAYVVTANAVANATLATPVRNSFDAICFISGETDFGALDFGGMSAGLTKVLPGDLIWNDPAGNVPTIRNLGNTGLEPAVTFQEMCFPFPKTTFSKCIDQFDVSFGRTAAVLQHIDPIFAGVTVDFDNDRNRVLCADELGKIDFSVHPPSTLPPGLYEGGISVVFREVRDICPTDDFLLPPPFPAAATPTPTGTPATGG